MATQLKNIVRFVNVRPGATVAGAHGLAWSPPGGGEIPQVPDFICPDRAGFTISAVTATSISVTNNTGDIRSVDVICELWHTGERAFGAASIENLTPKPFIVQLGTEGLPSESGVLGFGTGYLQVEDTEGEGGAPDQLYPWYDFDVEAGQTTPIAMTAPRNGTIRNLYVRHNISTDLGDVTYTLFLNGVPTVPLLSATVVSGDSVGFNIAVAVDVTQGDYLHMEAEHGELENEGPLKVDAVATMRFDD